MMRVKIKRINFSSHSGFTLIELLVVISIIGVLTGFIVTNFLEARRAGRDAQRKADLSNIKGALEQFRSQYGEYPHFHSGDAAPGVSGWARVNYLDEARDWSPMAVTPAIPNLNPKFMTKIPVDPTVGNNGPNMYCYFHKNRDEYTLFARLEDANDPAALAEKLMPVGDPSWCTVSGSVPETCKQYTIPSGNCAKFADGTAIPAPGSVYNYWVNNPY